MLNKVDMKCGKNIFDPLTLNRLLCYTKNIWKEVHFMKKRIPNNINTALNKLTKGVQEIFGERAKKVILYGSYARGDFNKHSDIDIMILTDIPEEEMYKYWSQ